MGAGEETEARSAAMLRAICDASVEGIVLHRDGVILSMNRAAAAMIGRTPEDVVGKNLLEFVEPGSRDSVRTRYESGEEPAFQFVGLRKDGTAIRVEARSRNVEREDGTVRAVLLRDLSEQDQAAVERAETISLLRATLDSVTDGVLVVNREFQITLYNDRFRELWSIPDHILAQKDDDVAISYVEDQLVDPHSFRARIYALYATPELESTDSFELRDGRIFERSSRPQRIGDKVVGRVFTLRDVTAQRRAERTLEAAVQMRDEFLGIASHELFTPLTSLGVAIRGLRSMDRRIDGAAIPEAQRERLFKNAERQVERLARLVQALLDVTRIDGGHLKLAVASVDLRDVARDAIERFGPELERDGIATTLDAPAAVLGAWDATRLEQVITNLLSNAMKFGRGRPIEVAVRRRGDKAELTVRDHGLGIAEDQQALIFERFQRAVSSRHFAGLGLGLFITRQIVEAHGGALRLRSMVGEGAEFSVELPIFAEPKPEVGEEVA